MSKDKIISEHIFEPNGGYCVNYPVLKNWEMSLGYSLVLALYSVM